MSRFGIATGARAMSGVMGTTKSVLLNTLGAVMSYERMVSMSVHGSVWLLVRFYNPIKVFVTG